MEDPGTFLTALDLEIPGALHPDKPAILDAAHESMVNHEVFFFSGLEAKEEFDRDPLEYCGVVTDPVSGLRFRPQSNSPWMEHGGHTFFFLSDSTKAIMSAAPDSFAVPEGKIMPWVPQS